MKTKMLTPVEGIIVGISLMIKEKSRERFFTEDRLLINMLNFLNRSMSQAEL